MQAEETAVRASRLSNVITLLVTSVLLVLPIVLPYILPGLRPGSTGPSLCMSKQLLRVSCPGCGLTRSVCATMRLELGSALRMHLLGPVFIAIFASLWVLAAAGLASGRNVLPDPGSRGASLGAAGLVTVMIVYWIIRIFTGTLPP